MKNKILKAALAGVAVLALGVGTGTMAAWTDYGDIKDNSVGAGFLKLNLNGQTGQTPVAPIDFGKLAPGKSGERMIWIASNDGQSVPDGFLDIKFSNLADQENGCSSATEADADDCENGGTPGELSHIVNLQTSYYPEIATQNACATYPGQGGYDAFFPSGQGNLVTANGNTYRFMERTDPTKDLKLSPGEGVCVGIATYWPRVPSNQVTAPYNNDNIAQGDSFTFDVRFILSQV